MFIPQATPSRVKLSNFFLLFIWREVRRRVRSPSPTSSSFVRRDRRVEGLSKCLVPTTRLAATCFIMSLGMKGEERFHKTHKCFHDDLHSKQYDRCHNDLARKFHLPVNCQRLGYLIYSIEINLIRNFTLPITSNLLILLNNVHYSICYIKL